MKKAFGKFRKVEEQADFPFEIINDGDSAVKAIKILREAPYIAFDIETTGFNPRADDAEVLAIAFASPAYLGGLTFSGSGSMSTEVNQRVVSEIMSLSCPKIAHNGKFDAVYLEKTTGILSVNFKYDTLLGFYLLDEDPRRKRSLKYLGREFTSFPIIEFPGEGTLKDLSQEDLLRYNCSDSRLTLALYEIVRKELEKEDLIPLWELITFSSVALAQMEHTGVKVDAAKLERIADKAKAEEKELREALMKIATNKGFPDLKLKSPLSLRDFLFNVLKLKPLGTTPTGKPSTEEKVLRKLDHPFPKALLIWRKKEKLIKTYFENIFGFMDDNDRVHPEYRIWGTRSGRSSCTNPNIQNIPRDGEIRSIFIPEDDYFFIECDYAQFELRVMALYSKDKNLIGAFESGRDPHREISAFLFNKDFEDVTDDERRKGKTLNFAILYGMGATSLAEDLEVSQEEAASLIERYYSRFAQVKKWVDKQHRDVLVNKEVQSMFKRKRRFPELTRTIVNAREKSEILKQSVNTVIQGTASDFALVGLISVEDALKTMKSRPIMFIHDSIVVESPREEVGKVIEILRKEMLSFARDLPIPFDVEIKVGLNWGDLEKI